VNFLDMGSRNPQFVPLYCIKTSRFKSVAFRQCHPVDSLGLYAMTDEGHRPPQRCNFNLEKGNRRYQGVRRRRRLHVTTIKHAATIVRSYVNARFNEPEVSNSLASFRTRQESCRINCGQFPFVVQDWLARNPAPCEQHR